MIYGVCSRVLNGIKSIYVDGEVCIRINRVESEWFNVDSVLRKGCAINQIYDVLLTCL